MPVYGISITKRVSFRGANQEFSNVYHYDFDNIIGAADADDAIDEIKATEIDLHSGDVTFVLGRCWSAGQSPGENQMLTEKALSGIGNMAVNSSLDRERAVLMYWPAGFNVRGRPVFLRKWYHCCGSIALQSFNSGNLQNTTALSTGVRDAIATKVGELNTITAGATSGTLCAASGRDFTSGPVTYPWLEHHQLGDAWRGT